MSGITPIFGGYSISGGGKFTTVDLAHDAFKALKESGCNTIDTAHIYGDSEELLGKAGVAKAGFSVDTKAAGGFQPEGATRDAVLAQSKQSKELLGTNVDVYYLHAPSKGVPLEDSVDAVQEVLKSGFAKRWGLSNFSPEDVQRVHDICKQKDVPVPAVYQGNYSAFARRQEKALFPVLRKLGMSFFAYSPLAGGFLTKSKQQVADRHGRFDPSTDIGKLYISLWSRPALLNALEHWEKIAEEEGCSRAELAYRWVSHNSPLKAEYGDAYIFGASSTEQIRQTLAGVKKGPISDKAVKAIDAIWPTIEDEAPLDNMAG